MTAGYEAEVVRRYPELSLLVSMRDAGWDFRPLVDDRGQLSGIVGTWHWPAHTDALWIFDRHDSCALRLLADAPGAQGGAVWRHSGPLTDTIAALLELPAPGQPGAPTLVVASRSLLAP